MIYWRTSKGSYKMAHFNLEEQEQINKIKYFWKDYGKYILGLIIIVVVVYASSALWAYKSENDAAQAAVIYAKFTTVANNNDSKNMYLLADELQQKYAKTEYASFASMWAAKVAFKARDLTLASNYLNWVTLRSRDKSLVMVAKLRLADVYLEQNKTDQALAITLEKVAPEFQGLFYAKRGDIYVVAKQKAKAIDAYKAALSVSEGSQDLQNLVQMKLDVLGN